MEATAWAKIFAVAVITHLASTLYLGEILGRTFDPFWKPRLFYSGRGVREQYLATLYYAGAVQFEFVRRGTFGGSGFDFRGRVTRTTAFLCSAHCLFLVLLLLTGGLFAAALAERGWDFWQALPRPGTSAPMAEPPPPM